MHRRGPARGAFLFHYDVPATVPYRTDKDAAFR